jgi:predicted DCC family thiol-disulfide oxidoreductase YuxK
MLGDMPAGERMASWHLVEDGRVYSGGEAVPRLLRVLPGGRPLGWLAAAVQPLTNLAYRFVAERRTAFGRLVPAGAKRRAAARLRVR